MTRKFPTFAFIVLVFALVWLLNDFEVIDFNLPWLPAILVIISIGWIFNRFRK